MHRRLMNELAQDFDTQAPKAVERLDEAGFEDAMGVMALPEPYASEICLSTIRPAM
ncbi:MAG: hypothetical protein M1379_05725 [Firmicutes bacterium]|nr:hypothetical protein [Bacillota bacterium]